ncbi:acetylglutamate kinase [Candidatus Roizmanbacteria bacterium CG02_land_8_20_14_3_00_36_15]|uniref:Acetylglutamate kinase n=1 Tax=Candidatus Roizmanbacteria bacterium CG_4_9_14_0_2_um_filter_35_15 TaxID=1974836 RepID=A0A2M8F4R5_9BACT|nr:MAG: acetylglutamate kinase [Candidatus Roizmanbacteria bacterium CG03_land_8_20_14_0_80_36_21]PIV37364.1 MAG: acetylglutamate kinase [Candidatus Roizmanbacteria bacterium CG02_land_8_20_14_3_00_36_15]PJA52866.1 MAG: acetylglutamate kinase [Candidatus Roizmanbacteria bacterium CG_4_9_14_3_um_filter_36_11]PJC34296.1 MAG: acetylglutamate kinase [Candidatus Roizmanbacteria bacterium CG_4_9_14_0_2_um_filter_35_15]PJC82362.1 MAG: acetylglutamate kinase [Candidatus Roizmanbacteria bacterium CG_4_8
MIIIKVGGGKTINWDFIAEDVVYLQKKERVIIVHGASQTRDEIAKKLKTPTKIITSPTGISSVYTDKNAIDVFLMIYPGLVNKKIVAKLQSYGINAVGLSGIDGLLWTGKRKKAVYSKEGNKIKLITNNMTGKVDKVNINLINLLLENKYIPVISPPAMDEEKQIINTDNDWATAVMAGALKIKSMVVLFEAPGLLREFGDESSLVKTVDKNKLDQDMSFAQGRMKKKILGAKEAFRLGLKTMYWSDGRIKHPIIEAINGRGTIIS